MRRSIHPMMVCQIMRLQIFKVLEEKMEKMQSKIDEMEVEQN